MINQLDKKMSRLGEAAMNELAESMETLEPTNDMKLIEKLEKVLVMNSKGKKDEIR